MLNEQDRWKEAEPVARESLSLLRGLSPDDPRQAQSWSELGIALLGERRDAEAIPALRASRRIFLKLPGWGPQHYATQRVEAALRRAPGS